MRLYDSGIILFYGLSRLLVLAMLCEFPVRPVDAPEKTELLDEAVKGP